MTDVKGKNMEVSLGDPRIKSLKDFITNQRHEIANALPVAIKPERLMRLAITAVRSNPALGAADPYSFLGALMQAAQLGLEPNTPLGQAYLIPYRGVVQLQIGYQGYMVLCYRSGMFKMIYAHPVYAEDEFYYSSGLHETLTHNPADVQTGDPLKYYAIYHTVNGGYGISVWSRDRIERHRDKYSEAWRAFKAGRIKTTPWSEFFDSMAIKTVIKDLLKFAPKSAELQLQLSADESVKQEWSKNMLDVPDMSGEIVDVPDETDEEPEEKKTTKPKTTKSAGKDSTAETVPDSVPEENSGSDIIDDFFENE